MGKSHTHTHAHPTFQERRNEGMEKIYGRGLNSLHRIYQKDWEKAGASSRRGGTAAFLLKAWDTRASYLRS